MSDPEDVPAVIAAAEHAAATGDLAAAESLLHVALREQEAQFGIAHPDVASTLNNLAVVCEMTGKFDEAGRFYQRASELTLAALGPDHPLTATSRDNLRAFLQARGTPPEPLDAVSTALAEAPAATPVETPVAAPAEMARVPSQPPVVLSTAPTATVSAVSNAVPAGQPQTPPRHSSRRRARKGQLPKPASNTPAPNAAKQGQHPTGVGAAQPQVPLPSATRTVPQAPPAPARTSGVGRGLALAALLAVVVVLWWWWGGEDRATGHPPASSAAAPAVRDQAPSAPAPAAATGEAPSGAGASTELPQREAGATIPSPATPAASAVPVPPRSETPVATGLDGVRVLEARVCGTLTTGNGRWECTAPANSAAPGRVSFYTRIASSRDMTVHHLWFRAGVLQQDVELSIGANPSAGFRTFSRQVIDAVPGTEWRVELRTSDGRLLQEERIVVQ